MEKRDAHIVIDGIGEFDVKLSELTIDMEVDVSAPEF
jgi:hypothetical protein